MLDHPEVGSICSGGRYDNLAEYYTDKKLPGVGISIGLTRLFFVLDDCGMLSDDVITAPADALIIPMTEDIAAAVSLSTELRSAGVRTQLYSEQKKFKAKITYASKLGIPFALFLGDDEIAEGTVSVKDLSTGEQVKLPVDDAAQFILNALSQRGGAALIRQ
jgi:histidyl-tRNA synthetase